MLRISCAQMDSFEKQVGNVFVDEMWEHFQEFAPNICETAKEENVRKVIRLGIDRAASFGFTNRGPVRFYIELMFSFGCDFDSDPQYTWTTEILNEGSEISQTYRANNLFERYEHFAKATIGPKNQFLTKALRSLVKINPKDVVTSNGDIRAELRVAISQIWPERFAFVGRECIDSVVESAIACAHHYNVKMPASKAVAAALAILVGHRFDHDLLYPWIGRTLNSKSEKQDSDQRFEALIFKAKIYLGEVIKYWDQS